MRGSFFDDEGTVHTWGLPGTLLVSMEFDDREEEIAGADGETETVVAHFNKRERFQNVLFGCCQERPRAGMVGSRVVALSHSRCKLLDQLPNRLINIQSVTLFRCQPQK